MVKAWTINKIPRDDKILDRPVHFPPLQNLHLDLMEVKRKLKKGIPLVVVKKKPIKPIIITPIVEPKEDFIEIEDGDDVNGGGDDGIDELLGDDDEDMLADLADDDAKPVGKKGSPASTESTGTETVEEEYVEPKSPEQTEAEEKEEYLWRYKILKKQYKDREIPTYNEHDDLFTIKSTYNQTIREIALENNVENYRTYLVGSFMAMEYSFTNFLSIDMTGFASQQMLMMDKYDTMLIELGERSYNRWGIDLPIEIRLIGFVLLQAGIFYLGKIISEKAGSNIATIFSGLTGQSKAKNAADAKNGTPTTPNGAANTPNGHDDGGTPQRKMRGPSIKIEDIKSKAK